jgi:hypothetical protein
MIQNGKAGRIRFTRWGSCSTGSRREWRTFSVITDNEGLTEGGTCRGLTARLENPGAILGLRYTGSE